MGMDSACFFKYLPIYDVGLFRNSVEVSTAFLFLWKDQYEPKINQINNFKTDLQYRNLPNPLRTF